MKAVPFRAMTGTLGAPNGWDESKHGECAGLPVYFTDGCYQSCWVASWRERFAILRGKPVWLAILSAQHPPVALNVIVRKDRPLQLPIHHRDSSWLHRLIYRLGWPDYECEDCTGTGQGCECGYYAAVAPGKGPTRWHLLWRWIWNHRESLP